MRHSAGIDRPTRGRPGATRVLSTLRIIDDSPGIADRGGGARGETRDARLAPGLGRARCNRSDIEGALPCKSWVAAGFETEAAARAAGVLNLPDGE